VINKKFETINFLGLYFWLTIIAVSLSLFFFMPDLFEPERIRSLFSENLVLGLSAYFIISTLRGFTLIPSTPIVFAGILVFPPLPLFFVNLVAVYTSSAIVYYMARAIKFDRYFHDEYPDQIEKLTKLLKNRELPVIAVWGFAPMVPTDMIVYVCSVLRISVIKTLLGVSIGEGIICAVYIFGGSFTLNSIFELN
jgi:uncharacterized membrane protein YdjX (TVP38/TMEM64 family)